MKQRRALSAVAIMFAVHGAISGSFATRVPWIAERLNLDAGWLGIALLCPALGALLATPVAARIVSKFGGRRTTAAGITVYCAALSAPAFMPNLIFLSASLIIMGLAAGVSDVAMKSQGHGLEERLSRPIMSRLFGTWSLGTLAGAGIGTVASFTALDARLHLAWTAVALLVLSASAAFGLPASAATRMATAPSETGAPAKRRFVRPSPLLLAAVTVAFCASFLEGAAHSWSAVYITDIAGGSAGASSLGFAGFVASMAVGRLSGDALVQRFGPARVVQLGGLLAFAGGAAVVVARDPFLALIGFVMVGLGIAASVPIAVTAGARSGSSSTGITAVLAMVQMACMAAPGTVGGVASVISLPVAFGVTAALAIPVVLLAGVLRPAGSETDPILVDPVTEPTAPLAIAATPAAVGSVPMAQVEFQTFTPVSFEATVEIPAASRESETLVDSGVEAPALVPA